MFAVVFVRRLHADLVTKIVFGQRVFVLRRVVDGLTVAQPLVADFVLRKAVVVFDGSGEGFAYFASPVMLTAPSWLGCGLGVGGCGGLPGDQFGSSWIRKVCCNELVPP